MRRLFRPIDRDTFSLEKINLEFVLADVQFSAVRALVRRLRKPQKVTVHYYVDGEPENAPEHVRPVSGAIKSYLIEREVYGYPFCQVFYHNQCVIYGDPLDPGTQERIVNMVEKYVLIEETAQTSEFVTQCEFYGSITLSGAF